MLRIDIRDTGQGLRRSIFPISLTASTVRTEHVRGIKGYGTGSGDCQGIYRIAWRHDSGTEPAGARSYIYGPAALS